MRPRLVVASLLLLCAGGALAEDPDRELARLLDRWADDVGPDRLERAIVAARASLAGRRDGTAALATRLVLARLELAHGDAAYAASDAATVMTAKDAGDVRDDATALYLLAMLDVAHAEAGRGREGQAALRKVLNAELEKLSRRVTPERAGELIHSERRRVASLRSLEQVGRRAPPFSFEDANGGRATDEALRGEVVLVELWDKKCKASLADLPSLERAHERLANQGFVVVRVSFDDRPSTGRKEGWHECLAGPDKVTRDAWRAPALPRRYLLDRRGVVRFVDVWGAEVQGAVEECLRRSR